VLLYQTALSSSACARGSVCLHMFSVYSSFTCYPFVQFNGSHVNTRSMHEHSMYGDFDFDGLVQVSGVTGFIYLGKIFHLFTVVSFTLNCPGIKVWVSF